MIKDNGSGSCDTGGLCDEDLECSLCCDHTDICEDEFVCLICGECMRERLSAMAYDNWKGSREGY